MKFCRFCGKELVNGQCDCHDYQASIGNAAASNQYEDAYKPAKEPFLIQSFNLNFKSFSGFISSLRDQSGVSEPASRAEDPYERNVPIVPDCMQPEEDEIVVKQYNIAKLRTRLKFMKAEGRLMVTNKRVIFRAAGTSLTGNILQQHQFKLDEIGGIEIHKDYKFSILNFIGFSLLNSLTIVLTHRLFFSIGNIGTIIIGIILGILGLLPTFIVYKHFWLKLFCSIVASGCFSMAHVVSNKNSFIGLLLILTNIILIINLIIVCYLPNLVIKIKTKCALGALVIGSQKAIFTRRIGDDYCGFAEVMPWEDTIIAMNELGTLIEDLQKQGDSAIEKWSM
ncbi:MAG TPA: hypothetical protein PKY26_03005 [Acetivibrio clariflavus]|nr:hypothetical protein [Acetivibrio clariflavus]